jgi:hypothetical protein
MLSQFRFVKAEAADFESYVGCAKLADLSKYLEPLGFMEISREAFASHPDGGQYWDVVWERRAKMALPKLTCPQRPTPNAQRDRVRNHAAWSCKLQLLQETRLEYNHTTRSKISTLTGRR